MKSRKIKKGKTVRIHAHVNPLSHGVYETPRSPDEVDWAKHYPEAYYNLGNAKPKQVTIADIGCGFGSFLQALAETFPNDLVLGMEIREKAVQICQNKINSLRSGFTPEALGPDGRLQPGKKRPRDDDDLSRSRSLGRTDELKHDNDRPSKRSKLSPSQSSSRSEDEDDDEQELTLAIASHTYGNVSVIRSNVMKYIVNFFHKGQLEKMFFNFPDPHFKKSNERRRIISSNLLSEYAYILRPGGIIYNITDVKNLYDWTVARFEEHPLFVAVPESEWDSDPCVALMRDRTDEAKRVARRTKNTDKFVAVYRRLSSDELDENAGVPPIS